MKFQRYSIEYTDTFGNEANYAWVRRHEIVAPETVSEAAVIRRAKAYMGLNGVRCRKDTLGGDWWALYPRGRNTVLFITYEGDVE